MTLWKPTLLVFLLSCLGAYPARAERTWVVRPDSTGDVPTIQIAIDSAHAGDTVLLEPGRYTWSTQGNDDRIGDPSMISMRAGVILRGAGGAEQTILDAEGQGRVVLCVDVQAATIEGITITRGTTGAGRDGGGILIRGDSRPLILNCIIQSNTTSSGGGGAGIRCNDAEIRDCRIRQNMTGDAGFGGGIACTVAVVKTCTLFGNVARGGDSGGGQGGGIWSQGATIDDCSFQSNTVMGDYGVFGGGLYEAGAGAVTSCVFVDNAATGMFGRGLGGGAYLSDGSHLRNCVFVRNVAAYGTMDGLGGGIYCRPRAQVTRCTLVGNSSGVHVADGVGINACIIAWNTREACSGSGATWSCSDLFGNSHGDLFCGQDGGGNFSADPEFCGVDAAATLNVFLQQDSPCMAGNHPQSIRCETIGARPAGCGDVSIHSVTWSHVKALYR